MKKFKVYLGIYGVILLISAVGAGLGAVAVTISEKHPDYLMVGFWKGCVIFFVAMLVSVWFHEMAHMIAFQMSGMGMRAFYVCPFCFMKENGKMKIRFLMNLQIGFGGVAIPRIPAIKNENEFDALKKRFVKSLVAGPMVSALVGAGALLLAIYGTDSVPLVFRSYFFVFFSAMFLWAVYINVTSLFDLGSIVGDYAGARRFKKDAAYGLLQIYHYYLLQENEVKNGIREKNGWFMKELFEFVRMNFGEKPMDSMGLLLTDAVLYEAILIRENELTEKAFPIAECMERNMEVYAERLQFETYLQCFSHMVMFLSVNGRKEEAINLWERYNRRLPNSKTGKYRHAQVELFLYHKDSELLLSQKDMVISSLDSLFSKVKNYYEDELCLNKGMMTDSE